MTHSRLEASLFAAVDKGNVQSVRKLLRDGVDANIRSERGIPVLHSAIARDNPEIVTALLDAGANPNLRDSAGYSPIADVKGLDVARLVIHAGADLNVKCWNDLVPLDFFVRKKETELVQLFLHYGAEVPKPMRQKRYWESLGERCEPLRRIIFAHLTKGNIESAMPDRLHPAKPKRSDAGISPL